MCIRDRTNEGANKVAEETRSAEQEEARIAKERQAKLAEFDRIINSMKEVRIAEVEQAKKEREEARIAELEQTNEGANMVVEETRSAEQEEARIAKERQAKLAEFDRVINAVKEVRIAEVEQAKKEREEARIAELEWAKEGAKLAVLETPEEPKVVEDQDGEADARDVEEAQTEQEEEINTILAQDDNDSAESESFVQPEVSHPRPPTPPACHAPPMYLSRTSLFASQMSLRTINEGGACDFTPEFASPLATHSFHAVVPYRSTRTRLGLRFHEAMSDEELGQEMRKLSEATLMVKQEILKRKLSREMSPENVENNPKSSASGVGEDSSVGSSRSSGDVSSNLVCRQSKVKSFTMIINILVHPEGGITATQHGNTSAMQN